MADDIAVSIATPADAEEVAAVLAASYPALMSGSYDAEVLGAALPSMIRANPALLSSGRFYVARAWTGQSVGCGGWSEGRPGSGEREQGLAHIRHFATHPDWIGRGIGRLLYGRCETDAHAAGADRFECYSSLNAEGFYAALGFEAVEKITIPMGNDVPMPTFVMRRRIGTPGVRS